MRFKDLEEKEEVQPLPMRNIIPIGISKTTGEIVCIPKGKNPPTIALIGMRGSHKTMTMLKIVCGIVRYFGEACFWVNDITSESKHWLSYQDNKKFKKQLKLIGEKGFSLPVVHIYPNHKNLKIHRVPNYYKFGLPIRSVLSNIENFREVGASLEYIKNFVKHLLKREELTKEIIINEIESLTKEEMPIKSKRMFLHIINYFFNEEITDLEKGTISEVDMYEGNTKHGTYNLIPALAYSGCVPVLMTCAIETEKYFYKYINNVLRDIWNNQIKAGGYPEKYEKSLYFFIDELESLIKSKNNPECKEIINDFFTLGRPKRVGIIYSVKLPSLLTEEIRTNTQYGIFFANDKKQTKVFTDRFPLSPEDIKAIMNLPPGEAIACSSEQEKWLFIDPFTGHSYTKSGIVRIKVLPPNCSTKAPGKEESFYETD